MRTTISIRGGLFRQRNQRKQLRQLKQQQLEQQKELQQPQQPQQQQWFKKRKRGPVDEFDSEEEFFSTKRGAKKPRGRPGAQAKKTFVRKGRKNKKQAKGRQKTKGDGK